MQSSAEFVGPIYCGRADHPHSFERMSAIPSIESTRVFVSCCATGLSCLLVIFFEGGCCFARSLHQLTGG